MIRLTEAQENFLARLGECDARIAEGRRLSAEERAEIHAHLATTMRADATAAEITAELRRLYRGSL